jgi:hypothetical protein
LELLWLLVL